MPTIVIASRDRRQRLLETLARLRALPEQPPVILVDTGSSDGTQAAIAREFPEVELIECSPRLGSAARTVGARAARTPLIAFSDDDSWWAPGALRRASEHFERRPRLGLLAPRILVEPGARLDPTCREMRDGPLAVEGADPGPPVLGFLGCGAVVRRDAFLGCGGFHRHFGFGGEEQLPAIDLASAGWELTYVDDVVAHHAPEPGPRAWQGSSELRNQIWTAWLRRPLPRAARLTARLVITHRGRGIRALLTALRGLPWVVRERRAIPAVVERRLRALEDD
jgi:GT2 family glycosyltransferase